jgi:hypothetical protein
MISTNTLPRASKPKEMFVSDLNLILKFSEEMSGPKPLSGSTNDLKKSIGRVVLLTNTDIIELHTAYKKVKEGGTLTKSETERERVFKDRVKGLEEGLARLLKKPEMVKQDKFERYVSMMKTTVESAKKMLSDKGETEAIAEESIKEVKKEAKNCVEEIELFEKELEVDILGLNKTLEYLVRPSRKCGA